MSRPTIASIIEVLGRSMAWSKAAGWDPVGLQVGDAAAPADTVAVCHEVTEDVVAAVEAEPVDLLVTYHPLLFRPTTRLVAGPTPAGRALRLASLGVAVAVVHTAFDVAPGGCADALATTLGLEHTTGFGPLWGDESVKVVTFVPAAAADAVAAAMTGAGAGAIGGYTACSFRSEGHGTFLPGDGTDPATGRVGVLNREPEIRIEMVAPLRHRDRVVAALAAAHPYEEPAYDVYERSGNAGMVGRTGAPPGPLTLADVVDRVRTRLGGVPRVAGDPAVPVRSVACLPGSGGSFLDGIAGRVDVVVTGDVSHHRARQTNDRGTAVVDAGHVPTERPGVRALYAAVAAAVPRTVDLTGIDVDPWRGA